MSIILRFRSKDGMFRINADTSSSFQSVVDQLLNKVPSGIDINDVTISDKPNGNNDSTTKLGSLVDKQVSELNLKNGDLLYINYGGALATPSASTQGGSAPINSVRSNSTTTTTPTSTSTSIPISKVSAHGPINVDQLPVDDELDKLDGMIQRPISSMCRHGSKGMCEYCSPLSPWDESYRKEHSIKHISYHAYLNQQMAKFNKKELASSYIAPLDNPNYAIDLSCNEGHQPYPRGICSKCQPPPITLQLQKFRMIDHLEYANHSILNDFINVWRVSGVQRFGYLYGRYEKFDKVPMGIKAVVEAIVEPPQSDELDGITLLEWPDEQLVDEIAAKLGIYKVGVVFTDLTDSGQKDGTVLCKRHKDSYFLTNLEILMAAKFQIANPNRTKYSNTGQFSSKFVTCVISGGLQGEIEPRSYQVSTSGEALVKADLITGSTQPSQIYVNESNDVRYVPDISYSKINEYGLEVKSNAKPTFPGEFLLVSLTDSFPLDPHPMFTTTPGYVIENRDFLGDVNYDFQNLSTLDKFLKSHGSDLFDFHLLIYIIKLRILSQDECELLIKYVKDRQEQDYLQLIGSGGWMSLLTILEHST
ncbi:Npl4 ubiquitin-binding protein [Candida orthopsilosis Co 90-125]|uniref:Nuclear protein localization protein 4 n=1 Tax=Candida orthopsilosis (strain 90-125) TaxID=1136231 RepID=H8X1G2_CANO9|nr:Npl4 ubiquitin-binding protein [Candida orthopsilosis Co 90-125]CCG22202.1 Npl4 ubiquitin-binding protein [Candida orthopsilosis Co 90-125]